MPHATTSGIRKASRKEGRQIQAVQRGNQVRGERSSSSSESEGSGSEASQLRDTTNVARTASKRGVSPSSQKRLTLKGQKSETAGRGAPGTAVGRNKAAEGTTARTAVAKDTSSVAEDVTTRLRKLAKVGAIELDVASTDGFAVGDVIMIGDERNAIAAFGSIVLQSPLGRSHPVGTIVQKVKASANNALKNLLFATAAPNLSENMSPWSRARLLNSDLSALSGAGSCGPQALPFDQRWDVPRSTYGPGIGAGPAAGYGMYLQHAPAMGRRERSLGGKAGRLPQGVGNDPWVTYDSSWSRAGAGSPRSNCPRSPGALSTACSSPSPCGGSAAMGYNRGAGALPPVASMPLESRTPEGKEIVQRRLEELGISLQQAATTHVSRSMAGGVSAGVMST